MHLSARAPSILLVAIVVLATALLVAGYGVQVGVGIVAGALLGIAWIGALLAMNPRTRGGSTYAVLDSRSSTQPDPEFLQRHHQGWTRVAGVEASALRHVIPVGSRVETGGVRVELVAVELREHGGIATVAAYTRPPIGQPGHFVMASVADDAGTEYAVAGQGSGGGNLGTARYDLRFAPAPPSSAHALTIRIDSFVAPFPGPADQLDGPWEFRIEL